MVVKNISSLCVSVQYQDCLGYMEAIGTETNLETKISVISH